MIDCRYSRLAASSLSSWLIVSAVLGALAAFPPAAFEAGAERLVRRLILEQHQEPSFGARSERDHLDVGDVRVAVGMDVQALLADVGVVGARLVQGGAQAVEEALAHHLQEIELGIAAASSR